MEKTDNNVMGAPASIPEQNAHYKVYKERKRWLFLGLPFTFTKYTVTNEIVTIDKGLINTKEDDCFMYKIQDTQLNRSLGEKLFGLGTIMCYTGDTTNPILEIKHIKHSKEVKDYILRCAEEQRSKRNTLATMNIGVVREAREKVE